MSFQARRLIFFAFGSPVVALKNIFRFFSQATGWPFGKPPKMAVSRHFRQRSKFWGLLRGLTEICGSFFVLNVWRLSLRSYITVKKLIGSLVAMVTRSKLVIFSRILTTQFFQGHSSSVAIQHRWTAIIPLCRAGNCVLQLLSELFAICSKFPSGSPQTSKSVRSLMLTLSHLHEWSCVSIHE